MADPKELFPIIDVGGLAGGSPNKIVDATTAVAGLFGLLGFSFKDSSGNGVLPQLSPTGRILVDTADTGIAFKQNGELAAGSLSLAVVTGAVLTLNLTKKYNRFGIMCASRQASLFQVVYINDASGTPTETVIGEAIVGPGFYTFYGDFPEWLLDTTAGTGVQKVELKAKNFEVLSSLRGLISCFEVPAA